MTKYTIFYRNRPILVDKKGTYWLGGSDRNVDYALFSSMAKAQKELSKIKKQSIWVKKEDIAQLHISKFKIIEN